MFLLCLADNVQGSTELRTWYWKASKQPGSPHCEVALWSAVLSCSSTFICSAVVKHSIWLSLQSFLWDFYCRRKISAELTLLQLFWGLLPWKERVVKRKQIGKSQASLCSESIEKFNSEEMVSTWITSMYFVAIFGVLIGASAGSCHAIIGGRELQRLSPTLVFH